jgi:hypothetical protein
MAWCLVKAQGQLCLLPYLLHSESVKWTSNVEFFKGSGRNIFVSMNFDESGAVLKQCIIVRHYNAKHKEKYKICVGALRREKVGGGGLRHDRMS